MPIQINRVPSWGYNGAGLLEIERFGVLVADRLTSMRSDLDDLHAIAKSPVTARVDWWRAAVDADPSATPIAFTRAGPRGRLEAAAFLMLREGAVDGARWLTSARPGSDDAWEITARSPRARRALAAELAEQVGGFEGPWRLHLTGLHDGDALDVLAGRLPHAQLLRATSVPGVRFDGVDSVAAVLRASVRDGLARSERRIAAEGLSEEICLERRLAPLLEMRAEIEVAHRARDHDAGRASDLDDDAGARFWRSAYRYHAARGELELATLRLNGELAAYVVAFVDPPAYRVFDGRIVAAYRRYSPGRRLEVSVLERAFRDRAIREVDWMSSAAPERLIAVTGTESRWTMIASSDPPELRALELAEAAGS